VSQVAGRLDPAAAAGWRDGPARKGFFTDTSLCIGCKACEVACKEWNSVPEDGLRMLVENSVGARAVRDAPDFAPARLNLGNAYRGNQQYDKALVKWEKAVEAAKESKKKAPRK